MTARTSVAATAGVVLYEVWRDRDVSGVSGDGLVAHATAYPDGKVTLAWCTGLSPSVTIYDSFDQMVTIHGHRGSTRFVQIYPAPGHDGGWV